MGAGKDYEIEPEGGSPGVRAGVGSSRVVMEMLASSSGWLFILAVIGSALVSVSLFVFGFVLTVLTVLETFTALSFEPAALEALLSISIKIIDIFLVATVFYVISLGLYELFIAKAPLPGWVEIRDLDDLETKLLVVVVIALAVLVPWRVVTWKSDASTPIPDVGLAVGVSILAISGYLWVRR
ncbi:MAG: YqhA family protein [Methanofollis sp.]|uniref:YqhA family protein n=1 Tax=Methanofollis sp. TaxID=2052835 RepID=UPI00261FFAAB|nr:YqhA family protein [Methanofollis sp.]MDD4254843.1 YqhA family protein [Methanofollis sp.]